MAGENHCTLTVRVGVHTFDAEGYGGMVNILFDKWIAEVRAAEAKDAARLVCVPLPAMPEEGGEE